MTSKRDSVDFYERVQECTFDEFRCSSVHARTWTDRLVWPEATVYTAEAWAICMALKEVIKWNLYKKTVRLSYALSYAQIR